MLLVGTGKDGKIGKQECIKFMEAEFDRLDIKTNSELDLKELRQSIVSVRRFRSPGLGK